MEHDLPIKNGIVIPHAELEITASRAGGPGGQHVNKTSSKITIRWNVQKTTALTDEQKTRVLQKIQHKLTTEGDLIVHNSTSRSQHQNRELALKQLAEEVRKSLAVTKQRMATKISKTKKEARLQAKMRRGVVKKMRSQRAQED